MAEDTGGTATVTETNQDEPTTAPAETELGDAGQKALNAERKSRRDAEKRAAASEADLKKLQDRDKSESQRNAEQAKSNQSRAEQAEAALAAYRAAAAEGLDLSLAERLHGSTDEELREDAKELKKRLAPSGDGGGWDGGAREEARGSDMNSLIRRSAGVR